MSNKKQIEASLKSLILDDDREFVAMLSGEWGIGKTYFWEKFQENNLSNIKKISYLKKITNCILQNKINNLNSTVYISLFGYSSIQNLKNDIVLKLSKTEHGKTILNDAFQSLRTSLGSREGDDNSSISLSGSIVGSALSLIPEKSLAGSVICFDDFERLSCKIDFKDVMGLISQFKEQKKCKIIMVLNEGELSESNQKIFSTYKEKIVDYTFHYKPNQKELFEAIKEDIEKIRWCEPQTIYDFFEKIELKNIRIMKQALYQLNYFSFIGSESYDKKVLNEFVEIALNLSVFKAKTNYKYQAFKEMVGFRTDEELRQDLKDMYNGTEKSPRTDEHKDKHEKALRHYHNLNFIYLKGQLEFEVYKFMDTHMINKAKIKELLQDKTSNMQYDQIHTKITDINLQYTHSFHVTDTETSQALKVALTAHKDSIRYIFTYSEFKWYIDNLNKFSNITLEEGDEKEIIENYIKFYLDNPESNKHYRFDKKTYLENLCDDYAWATTYKTDYLSKGLSNDIALLPEIIASIRDARLYSDADQRRISVFDENDFKESIKEATPDYINHLVHVLSWSIGGNDFEPIKSKISTALSELSNDNSEFKRKAEAILEVRKS